MELFNPSNLTVNGHVNNLQILSGCELAVKSADNYRTLRQRGITVRKTIDVIIGTFCISEDIFLLHNDKDFEPMARHLGLKSISQDTPY